VSIHIADVTLSPTYRLPFILVVVLYMYRQQTALNNMCPACMRPTTVNGVALFITEIAWAYRLYTSLAPRLAARLHSSGICLIHLNYKPHPIAAAVASYRRSRTDQYALPVANTRAGRRTEPSVSRRPLHVHLNITTRQRWRKIDSTRRSTDRPTARLVRAAQDRPGETKREDE